MDISYRTIGFKSYFSNYADNSKDLKYKGHLGFNQLKLNDGRSENIIDFSVLASKNSKIFLPLELKLAEIVQVLKVLE